MQYLRTNIVLKIKENHYVYVNYDSVNLCQTIILVMSCVEFLRISLPIVCSYLMQECSHTSFDAQAHKTQLL